MKSIFVNRHERADMYSERMRALMLEEDDWEYDSVLEEVGWIGV